MPIDPLWIGLIGTVIATVGVKVIDHFLGKNRNRVDDAARIRDELRIEITNQREEIAKLEAERDKYREELFKLRGEYQSLQLDLKMALNNIKNESDEAVNKLPDV